MSRLSRISAMLAVILVMVGSMTIVGIGASAKESPSSGHPGSRSLGVDVSSDDDALDNVPVTVVNKKTGDQVFSGFTDSAGQVDVTLPQGQYDITVQGQKSKSVNLNKDQNVSFELNSDERPNG